LDYGIRGDVALVVGGARGIGYAAAKALAEEGARVAIADIEGTAATEAADRLRAEKACAVAGFKVDIVDHGQVTALMGEVAGALGAPSIVVHTAAIVDDKLFVQSTPADWHRMINICLFGAMHVIYAALPAMIERRQGRIICLASDSARLGQARLSYYAAAKAGVIALVKSVAQEVGKDGVTLNIVSPGATNTELRQAREASLREQMGKERYARRQESVLRMYPTGRIGEPEDIAAAILFLASRNASWITGQVLSVNGGFVMP
jgi:NAD(P)-dependent dehydrogenase (short-subunit alcohol dehydrogenase family)